MIAPPTLFGLVRHAPTLWNRRKRIQGIADSPLTADGRCLAETWGVRLAAFAWDRIVTSDLERARHTARLVNLALDVQVNIITELREMDWGRWTGRTLRQVKSENTKMLAAMLKTGWGFQPPGGENRLAVWERGRRALVAAAETWPGQTILVITHQGMIKALIYRLSGRKYLPVEPAILNPDHLHWIAVQGGVLSLVKFNAVNLNSPAA